LSRYDEEPSLLVVGFLGFDCHIGSAQRRWTSERLSE
jgi:hypothetical protein